MDDLEHDPILDPQPLEPAAAARADPTDGVGLCLSGGGYRAMLFHVGALWRLMDSGRLLDVTRVASVSGGSITAGVLALAWPRLRAGGVAAFEADVVAPLRKLASTTIQNSAVLGGIFLPGTISDRVAGSYDEILFKKRTLQDLPDEPRFFFLATNLETGTLFRFSKRYARDYRVGGIDSPEFRIAAAVAASSAFPPVLSPFVLDVAPGDFTKPGDPKLDDRFREEIALTDGGVYDNLGLEPVWKRCRTVYVSDGGGRLGDDPSPPSDWARQSKRVLDVIDHQVRNLRKLQIVGLYEQGRRDGVYWGIRTDIADYKLADAFQCPHDKTLAIADIPTRLKRMDPRQQERLINWGYAVADAGLRSYGKLGGARPGDYPYPASGIG